MVCLEVVVVNFSTTQLLITKTQMSQYFNMKESRKCTSHSQETNWWGHSDDPPGEIGGSCCPVCWRGKAAEAVKLKIMGGG